MDKVIPHCAVAAAVVLLLWTTGAAAATCSAESGTIRVPLLELYTSEGCDSCPPADRWVSALPQRGFTIDRMVALAFHVDYWNYLGWTDPYAQAAFSARQREANRRIRSRAVYTPQLLLNGLDYRRALFRDDFGERVAELNAGKPRAAISLQIDGSSTAARVRGSITIPAVADRGTAHAYLALYENGLVSEVRAGENRGKRLLHDFVVHELTGPMAPDAEGRIIIDQPLRLPRGAKPANLHLSAFAQDLATGVTLQALALPYCHADSRVK